MQIQILHAVIITNGHNVSHAYIHMQTSKRYIHTYIHGSGFQIPKIGLGQALVDYVSSIEISLIKTNNRAAGHSQVAGGFRPRTYQRALQKDFND